MSKPLLSHCESIGLKCGAISRGTAAQTILGLALEHQVARIRKQGFTVSLQGSVLGICRVVVYEMPDASILPHRVLD